MKTSNINLKVKLLPFHSHIVHQYNIIRNIISAINSYLSSSVHLPIGGRTGFVLRRPFFRVALICSLCCRDMYGVSNGSGRVAGPSRNRPPSPSLSSAPGVRCCTLTSAHEHRALTPLRFDPSVSIPLSTSSWAAGSISNMLSPRRMSVINQGPPALQQNIQSYTARLWNQTSQPIGLNYASYLGGPRFKSLPSCYVLPSDIYSLYNQYHNTFQNWQYNSFSKYIIYPEQLQYQY